jgi:hypothetical protein
MHWDRLYANSVVTYLAKYGSDHYPLVLHIEMVTLELCLILKYDASWFEIAEFNELVVKWWKEFKLSGDIGKYWHEKLKFMRRKMKGWHKNFLGKKKKKVDSFVQIIQFRKKNREHKDFTNEDVQMWLDAKSKLDDIYLEEERY